MNPIRCPVLSRRNERGGGERAGARLAIVMGLGAKFFDLKGFMARRCQPLPRPITMRGGGFHRLIDEMLSAGRGGVVSRGNIPAAFVPLLLNVRGRIILIATHPSAPADPS